ncbi:hypothetical protein TraAM80_01679 [Trypanosoma rangeli]|uniref:Uncharacterized protein n=1 Tax=Trypanosoma rangeli TaxID=5698 RepID=A0A422NXN3_TRYRA|nr:uncharacterized protein TraAM80_01679 [Trypanosoma rangeli]RNF10240.1 hypothetical protein TraAM80_01679 [Trypanosoma rangeli]|eukprot:RNF10240.1 hypothetical protein TraAM80_01679 [Trypanosoma rangeli]
MTSSGASQPRATSSSPLANTPPVTTTTTTTVGTLSGSDPRQQQQRFPSSQSPVSGPPNTSTNSDTQRPLYADDGELPQEILSYFEHWASPTEVLQLRALCSDVVSKYKHEATRLLRELQEVKQGRDALQREVEETQRLRQLYSKADAEYEKARRERSQWSEERELLRLRLQQLSVENQRLQQMVSGRGRGHDSHQLRAWTTTAPLALSGGSGAAIITSSTTPLATGSSIPTPSPSLSSVAEPTHGGFVSQQARPQRQQPLQRSQRQQRHHPADAEAGGDTGNGSSGTGEEYYYYCGSSNSESSGSGDVNEALREQLRLVEELHRCSTEYAELGARFHFAQTLWDLTAARWEQRFVLLTAENEKLKGQLRHWRSVAEDTVSRLDAVTMQLRDRCDDVEEARRALQAAHEERQAAVAAERGVAEESAALMKAAHAEELAGVQQQLQLALDDSARTREKLQGALDVARRRADAQREELLAVIDAAEQRCGDALRAKLELETALAASSSSHEQQRAQLEHELHLLRSAQETARKKWEEQSAVLKKTQDSNAGLTMRLLEVEEEAQTVAAQLSAALEELRRTGELEEALVNARARAEEAEFEVETQQSYYTEQLRIHQTALAELQRQRDEEVQRLGRAVERLQRRYTSSKVRLAAAVKGIGRAGEATPMSLPPMRDGQDEQPSVRPSTVRGILLDEASTGPDAVVLLQQSAAIVATLARTLHRGTEVA